MTDERLCSNCGREFDRIVFCERCRHEFLCGQVAEDCPVEGCLERRRAFYRAGEAARYPKEAPSMKGAA